MTAECTEGGSAVLRALCGLCEEFFVSSLAPENA